MDDSQAADGVGGKKGGNQVNASWDCLQIGGKDSLREPDEQRDIGEYVHCW